jgi:deoxyribodipyrimidine photolyase-related protein
MSSCVLIFPHQIFTDHPVLKSGREVALIEDSLFFGDPSYPARFHQQKLVLHRSTLKSLEDQLKKKGFKTRYFQYEPGATIRKVIQTLADDGVDKIHFCDPVDYMLSKRIRESAQRHGIECEIVASPLFLNDREWNENYFSSKKPFMAKFYTEQRKRLGILVDDDHQPAGGKWSYDEDNRKSLPKGHQPPALPESRPSEHDQEAIDYVRERFPDHPGNAGEFWFPSNSRSAGIWFKRFLEQRFQLFGDYEDALSAEHPYLYHSILTPMMNIGLISPRKIIDDTLEYADEHDIPLNSVEGFIRQIIGWREFMRAMYELHGTEMRTRNFWNFKRKMPQAFYDGTTGIPPVDLCIRRARDHAYCHHIERLMVLGNFMLLCRIDPDDVYRWFMELFIDAYDWVMVPNVYAMSQFADGGLFTTKPYLSGSNYIRKMSNFPKGDWCQTWDGLFWTFIADHRDFFTSQPRLSMMARTYEKMSPEKKRAHRKAADGFLATL